MTITHMEKFECIIVYCVVLSVCTSASPKISTPMICAFAGVIDDYVSRTSDFLCIHLNHKITEQGLEFSVVPSLRPLHTISRREERKSRDKILPTRKPHCLHRTCPTCIGIVAMCMWSCLEHEVA